MLTRPLPMNVVDNPLVISPFSQGSSEGGGSPPVGNAFLLLDGTNFKLLDGTNLLLL